MTASVKIVDLTNVKEGGQFTKLRVKEGDYAARITSVVDAQVKKGDNEGKDQYLFTISLEGRHGATYPFYCTLVDNQLWKLRNLMIAAGIPVPKKRLRIDPNKAVGRLIGITLQDDEYDGREQSSIAAVFPASDLDQGTEDSDTDADEVEDPDVEDDAEDEEEVADPIDEMNRNALKVAIRELDKDASFKKSEDDDALRGRLRELQAAATPDLSDLDEDEDDEEETPPPPPKKTAAKKRPAAKPKPATDEEDLDELDIEDL